VVDAVVVAVNLSGIGESLFVSQIIGPAQTVQGVSSVVVTNPPGTIIPAASEALRTTDALVVIS